MSVSDIKEAAMTVHSELGAGFTENVYHSALAIELSNRGVEFSTEASVPIMYKGHSVGRRRPDMFVQTDDGMVVVELKAGSDRGSDQLMQYLTLLGTDNNFDIHKGLLIQFNDTLEIESEDV